MGLRDYYTGMIAAFLAVPFAFIGQLALVMKLWTAWIGPIKIDDASFVFVAVLCMITSIASAIVAIVGISDALEKQNMLGNLNRISKSDQKDML